MQALARVRTNAARLRDRAQSVCPDLLTLLDEAMQLTDTMRIECGELRERRMRLEAELEKYSEESRELIDRLPCALICTDRAGHIVEANRAAAALLGLSQAKLKEELLLHFTEDRAAFTDLVQRLPYDRHPVHASARIRPRDRAPFAAEITLVRDPRMGDDRWLWQLERVSAPRMSAGTPIRRASALSRPERSAS
jgi:PAS domain S-box-containing protein